MRLLLDTCVVSELNLSQPNSLVEAAVEQIGMDDLYLSVITLGEIRKGISMLPQGRRRLDFEQWLARVAAQFANRILDIDVGTAYIWGDLSARPAFRGRATLSLDLLIAATALNHGMVVMTRNTKDFRETGVPILDPWQDNGG